MHLCAVRLRLNCPHRCSIAKLKLVFSRRGKPPYGCPAEADYKLVDSRTSARLKLPAVIKIIIRTDTIRLDTWYNYIKGADNMKLDLIRKALDLYKAEGCKTEADYEEVVGALQEVNELADLIKADEDLYENEVRVLSVASTCDLGNALFYDMYGLQAKLTDGNVTLKEYEQGARQEYGGAFLTSATIKDSYDLIVDLWAENESEGIHNADGTFCKN